jgi:hypothetical protein
MRVAKEIIKKYLIRTLSPFFCSIIKKVLFSGSITEEAGKEHILQWGYYLDNEDYTFLTDI